MIDRFEITADRSSRLKTFFKEGNLKYSSIFTRKHLLLESLFNKVALKFFIKKSTGGCFQP